MAASRRLMKELQDIRKIDDYGKVFRVDDPENILNWKVLVMPPGETYKTGVFRILIEYPAEYPFKPPKITFKTKIYHPNVDEKGQVCLPIISTDNWKPATKTEQVLKSLIELVDNPEPEHPLRADLAEEYTKDKRKFVKNAQDYLKKNCEKL